MVYIYQCLKMVQHIRSNFHNDSNPLRADPRCLLIHSRYMVRAPNSEAEEKESARGLLEQCEIGSSIEFEVSEVPRSTYKQG